MVLFNGITRKEFHIITVFPSMPVMSSSSFLLYTPRASFTITALGVHHCPWCSSLAVAFTGVDRRAMPGYRSLLGWVTRGAGSVEERLDTEVRVAIATARLRSHTEW